MMQNNFGLRVNTLTLEIFPLSLQLTALLPLTNSGAFQYRVLNGYYGRPKRNKKYILPPFPHLIGMNTQPTTTFPLAFRTTRNPQLHSLFRTRSIMHLLALLKNRFTLEQ